MQATKKIPLGCFALVTLISISLISYSMSLYFTAYNTISAVSVEIKDINIIYDTNYVSVVTTIYILNPTDLSLKYNSLTETLYLNGKEVGYNFFYVQQPKPLPPKSNTTAVTITITNVPRSFVDAQTSKSWFAEFRIFIYGIPLIESTPFIFRRSYP